MLFDPKQLCCRRNGQKRLFTRFQRTFCFLKGNDSVISWNCKSGLNIKLYISPFLFLFKQLLYHEKGNIQNFQISCNFDENMIILTHKEREYTTGLIL